jgi:hypothetical protein
MDTHDTKTQPELLMSVPTLSVYPTGAVSGEPISSGVDGKMTPFTNSNEDQVPIPSQSLLRCDIVETPEQFEAHKKKLDHYRRLFKSEEDFELFAMLPISGTQRQKLIDVMLNAEAGFKRLQ